MSILEWPGVKAANGRRSASTDSIAKFLAPARGSKLGGLIKSAGINLALAAAMFGYALVLAPHQVWRWNSDKAEILKPAIVNAGVFQTGVFQTGIFKSEIVEAEPAAAAVMPSEQQQKADRVAYLIIASYNGELAEIKRLLAEGADVNATNERGVTPLISATAGYQLGVVEFLLSLGADPTPQTDEGFNAFDFAFYNNDVGIARLIRIEGRWPKPMARPKDITARISEELQRSGGAGRPAL